MRINKTYRGRTALSWLRQARVEKLGTGWEVVVFPAIDIPVSPWKRIIADAGSRSDGWGDMRNDVLVLFQSGCVIATLRCGKQALAKWDKLLQKAEELS